MRIIKKYENHKHYDTSTGAYVSMKDLGNMVAAGERVQVMSDRTGQDVTLEALARSLYDHLRDRPKDQPPPFTVGAISKLIKQVADPAKSRGE